MDTKQRKKETNKETNKGSVDRRGRQLKQTRDRLIKNDRKYCLRTKPLRDTSSCAENFDFKVLSALLLLIQNPR